MKIRSRSGVFDSIHFDKNSQESKYAKPLPGSYPEMRGQRELTIVAVCTFAYTSG